MQPPADPNPTADFPPDPSRHPTGGEQPGERVGPYKLLQALGEGGMGTVWVAEQEQPVKRRVALKLIKPGMDSAQVLRRFEAERQALALMDHPNIAKVLDAGTTAAGRPYFAMELVKGVPITKYCDELHLSIPERLALFVSVCQAVQHAHQKGIIHRDIKPSNVLIAVHDGKPMPKVIDFGVAKALNQRLTEESMYTEIGAVIGTLEYMSPEQAELSPLDIDTRADIYSLGVLLYQLLTGTTPLSAKRLRQAGYVEAVRIVTQEEPTKPSTRLSESKEELAKLAAERRTDPKKLMKTIRGELDWIVMKCLEKDRTRRYETANGLARDIERHLADEPVEAGPPSKAYRLRKFVRRYKAPVFTAGALALVLFVAIAITTSAWMSAKKSARTATDAFSLAERQRTRAEAEAERATNEATNARKAKEIAEFESYVANLIAVDASFLANEPVRLRSRLDACPESLRNWEWHHFNARSDQSLLELSGHKYPVRNAAFSARGDRVVTASGETTARIWDAVTGKQLMLLHGHTRPVISAAFSASGDRVATASGDNTARVWDAFTGKELARYRGRGFFDHLSSAAFNPSGDRVVSVSSDRTIRVWNSANGKELAILRGHTFGAVCAVFSPSGDRVVTASIDNTARVWDATTGQELTVLRGHTQSVRSAAFSPSGDRVVTASDDKTARVWDSNTGQELVVLRGHIQRVQSAAFSPSGDRVVTASNDKTARIWDTATGQELAQLHGHEREVQSAAFSPSGDQVVTASDDKTARLWNATSGKELAVLRGHKLRMSSASFNPSGDRVITASDDKTARVWDAGTGQEPTTLRGETSQGRSTAFSPSGDRLVTSKNKIASVWDATTGRKLAVLRGHTGLVTFASFSPSGDRVVTTSVDKTARVWEPSTGKELALLRGHASTVSCAAFSPAGDRLVTASYDNTARVWDAVNGKELALLRGHSFGLNSASFNPFGNRVVTASFDRTARVWDAATGIELVCVREASADRNLSQLGRDQEPVRSAEFNPSGDKVVTACDNFARVWDATTGRNIAILRGHEGLVARATFDPAGDRVVTASQDNSARVWDAVTGKEVGRLGGHNNSVNSAEFNAAGDRVVTASRDGTARVWDAVTGKELLLLRSDDTLIASFSLAGNSIIAVTADKTVRLWHSVPYRERYPAILAARAAEKTMKAKLAPRIAANEDLDAIVQSLVDDKSIDDVHRRAGLAIICEERERPFAEKKP